MTGDVQPAPPPQPPEPTSTPVPVFRISMANAALLSTLYLSAAVVVELIRRLWNPRWVDHASYSLEAFPARTLELFGLFKPIHEAYLRNELEAIHVRFIYGFVTVGIIFTLGAIVGGLMTLIAKLASRQNSDQLQ